MKKILFISFALLVSFKMFSQAIKTKNIVGENITIRSKILEEDRQIQVYLPKDYGTSNKKYPVVYLLDGQRFFLYGASLVQSFSEFKLTPDFIVVGITNVQASRMRTFSAGAKKFIKFLENDVVKLVDATYRTSKKRLLFGWAYGGGFGIETLVSKPNLFDGYILSSPFPVSSKMDRFKSFVKKNNTLNSFLYFVSDAKEFGVKGGTEELGSFLNENTTRLRWTFKVLSGEEHRSTVYPALYHGIRDYFEYYTDVRFADLEEFTAKGGMTFVRNYYKKRTELYDLPNEMSTFTKYNLIRLAIRANNLVQFETFLKEFKGLEFITDLRTSWACILADFYVTSDKKQKALQMYQFITSKHPKSIRAQKGLGDAYSSLKMMVKAKKAYAIAESLK
jgi:pimeloyl-ACP methyl ester carboxylesterase